LNSATEKPSHKKSFSPVAKAAAAAAAGGDSEAIKKIIKIEINRLQTPAVVVVVVIIT